MQTNQAIDQLNKLLANTYALYLKTQNYHWHVKGAQFYSLHQMFEHQYTDLAAAIDEIAERIVTMGGHAVADFAKYQALTQIQSGDANQASKDMLVDLVADHQLLLKELGDLNQKIENEATLSLVSERMAWHEKTQWMLQASIG